MNMLTNLRRRIILILSVTILIVLVFTAASAQDAPQLPPDKPSCFYGTVQQDGANVEGQVSIWMHGQTLASSDIKVGSVYVLKATGGVDNEPVDFKVNDDFVENTNAIYQSGECVNINLFLGTTEPVSTLYLPVILK